MAFKGTAFLFLLVQTSATISDTERDYNLLATDNNSEFSRFNHFKPLDNRQLLRYVVKQFNSPSLLSCAQQCLLTAWCTSTNFKLFSKKDSKGTCELNKHDISVVNENVNFAEQKGVIFSLLLKDCPQGWFRHENSCYLIHNTPTPRWNDALTFCQNHRAHPPIIKSADENGFIFRLMKSQPDGRDRSAWIGLNRKMDDKFYWLDGTPSTGRFSAWAQGEPNRRHEKCVFILVKKDRQKNWFDSPCTYNGTPYFPVPVVLCQKGIF